jgi:hypothetical protein
VAITDEAGAGEKTSETVIQKIFDEPVKTPNCRPFPHGLRDDFSNIDGGRQAAFLISRRFRISAD